MTQTMLSAWLAIVSGCTTLHLPDVYARLSLTPGTALSATGSSAGAEVAFDAGLAGDLGDTAPPPSEAGEGDERATAPSIAPAFPCRVSSACSWERRASAEARARVIGEIRGGGR